MSTMDLIKKNLENPPSAGRATTSMRISGLEELQEAVQRYGFRDRSHFFQLAASAFLKVAAEGKELHWPPKFVTHD